MSSSNKSLTSYFTKSSASPSSSTEFEDEGSNIDQLSEYSDDRNSEEDSHTDTITSSEPPKKRPRNDKRTRHFIEDWKLKYLMWPLRESESTSYTSEMICIQCQEKLKSKSSTAYRHIQRKHPSSLLFSKGKKERLIAHFESMYNKQKSTIFKAIEPNVLLKTAPFKLAFTIAKHKMPFNSCGAFLEFARAADPYSSVLKNMAGSRETITKRTQEIYQVVLRPGTIHAVNTSPFWSLLADESTDSATKEQLGVYVRYFDLVGEKIAENFLEMKNVIGHPTANNIFTCLMEVLDPEDTNQKLPLNKLAGFTCDGASVMISPKEGVFGKLRRATNEKLFSTHCPPHRLVLASKEAQRELPNEIEKTLSDTLFFFKDSPVRRDEFKKLKELVEPESPHLMIIQYHKVRWLSLADCVSRVVKLLPLLVRYFEEQAEDTQNRPAVRSKCRDLHVRLSEPDFQLYLYFLNPHLDLLAHVNKWLQSTQLTLHTVYCKIQALYKSFIAPIVLDDTKGLNDEDNLRSVEDAIPLLPGSDFQKHLSDCSDHALLSTRQLNDIKKTMYNYVITVGRALERRFPDADFIIRNTAFLDPSLRKLQKPDMQALAEKFHTGKDPFQFDVSVLSSEYRLYENDSTLDFLYELCGKDNVKFWCRLYKQEYKVLSSLALILLVISPTSVICERGFSIMNYVKNEFRSVLTQQNLNACMGIALTEYTLDTFPFSSLLKN